MLCDKFEFRMWNIRLNDICIMNKSSYSKGWWKFINYLNTKNIIKGKINEIKYLNPMKALYLVGLKSRE